MSLEFLKTEQVKFSVSCTLFTTLKPCSREEIGSIERETSFDKPASPDTKKKIELKTSNLLIFGLSILGSDI